MPDVVVLGGIFRDVLVGDGLVEEGREFRIAGSGLYAACAAARLGSETVLVAPVGAQDAATAEALAAEAGVDTRLIVCEGASGTFAHEIGRGTERLAGYRPATTRAAARAADIPGGADLYCVFGHPEWDPLQELAAAGSSSSAPLLYDRQGWLSRDPGSHAALSVAAAGRILLANAGEVREEFGSEALGGDGILPPDGYDAAIVKDGRWGLAVFERGEPKPAALGAHRVAAASTIGSGDILAGAIAAALAGGERLRQAAGLGAAAAAAAIASRSPLPDEKFAEEARGLEGAGPDVLVPHTKRASARVRVSHTDQAGSMELAQLVVDWLRAEGFADSATQPGASAEVVRVGDSRLGLEAAEPPLFPRLVDFLLDALA